MDIPGTQDDYLKRSLNFKKVTQPARQQVVENSRIQRAQIAHIEQFNFFVKSC